MKYLFVSVKLPEDLSLNASVDVCMHVCNCKHAQKILFPKKQNLALSITVVPEFKRCQDYTWDELICNTFS